MFATGYMPVVSSVDGAAAPGDQRRDADAVVAVARPMQADEIPLLEPQADHDVKAGPGGERQPFLVIDDAPEDQQETDIERMPDIAMQAVEAQRLVLRFLDAVPPVTQLLQYELFERHQSMP